MGTVAALWRSLSTQTSNVTEWSALGKGGGSGRKDPGGSVVWVKS